VSPTIAVPTAVVAAEASQEGAKWPEALMSVAARQAAVPRARAWAWALAAAWAWAAAEEGAGQ